MTNPTGVYLDTNSFILLREGSGDARAALRELLELAPLDATVAFVTSELTLSELLVKPLADRRQDLAAEYESWISDSSWLHVAAVRRDILRAAASLRARRKSLKLPDAIHLATAMAQSCGFLVSDDRGFRDEAAESVSNDGHPIPIRLDPDSLRDLKTRLLAP